MFLGKKRIIKPQMLVLIDWENLFFNMVMPNVERFSLLEGFDGLMRQLAEISAVMNVFVFSPPQAITNHLGMLHTLGFYPIVCPKVRDKVTDKEIDTVDPTLIKFAREMIGAVPALTHLCLCSGDKDFLPLLREAKRKGLEIAVCASDYHSLAQEMIAFIDRNPQTKKKMFFLFSPLKKTK